MGKHLNWCSPNLVISVHISMIVVNMFLIRKRVQILLQPCANINKTAIICWHVKPKKPPLCSEQPVCFSLCCASDRTHAQFPRSQQGSAYVARTVSSKGNVSVYVCLCANTQESRSVQLTTFLNEVCAYKMCLCWADCYSCSGPAVPSWHSFPEARTRENVFGQPLHNVSLVCPLKTICNPVLSMCCY